MGLLQVTFDELYSPPSGVTIRAGVIPYTIKDNKRYYLIGVHRNGIYTDMGGGCKTSKKERPIDCLIREVNEETDPVTAKEVIASISRKKGEVWRETERRYEDLGYPFQQTFPGPIHRYYILLEINDPLLRLGGPTNSEEVDMYQWIEEDQLRLKGLEEITNPCRNFFIRRLVPSEKISRAENNKG